jgi:hypothetical protein
MKSLKTLYDSLVRDATKVTPMSKGEMKRRLNEIIHEVRLGDCEHDLSDCCLELTDRNEHGFIICTKCKKPCRWL